MKAISAAIVILVGAVILMAGIYHQNSDTRTTVSFVVGGVGILGLLAWYREMAKPDSR